MTASENTQIMPRAWMRVSNISGQSSGLFETQDVELRSESLVPLYDQSALDAALAAERQAAWEAINQWIKPGDLGGNGYDKNAQRNGMILAANVLMERIERPNV